MGKSVNEYYAEKMKKLLEMQKEQTPAAIYAPQKPSPKEKLERAAEQKTAEGQNAPQKRALPRTPSQNANPNLQSRRKPASVDGRGYYESFRKSGPGEGWESRQKRFADTASAADSDSDSNRNGKSSYSSRSGTSATASSASTATSASSRRYVKPGVTAEANKNGAGTRGTGTIRRSSSNKKYTQKTPEQTYEDKLSEEERREEARIRAERGKRLRKIRDNLISVFLIGAVAVAVCVVVYRLVFVISHINVEGTERYSKEEILAASGISEGDHLYSFRNSSVEKLITMRCPAVSSVNVDKVAPSSVNLYIKEEPAVYYANFYGEYRELSESLRVLYAVSPEAAENENLIRIKLPSVTTAYSGKRAEFSGVRSDVYIYDVTTALQQSPLWDRVKAIDLENKYDIAVNCDGKYLIELGDSSSIQTKLKIASQVLNDSMFQSDIKAKIDVSSLSATGVVTDENLDMSRFS